MISQLRCASRRGAGTNFKMTSCNFAEPEVEFGDLLQEFQYVLEEFRVPNLSKPCIYEQHLGEAKKRAAVSDRVSDSGIEDSDCSREQSPGSSLNTSEEELNTAGVNIVQRAKLGDTRDLQSFIENLDKELAEM